MHAYSVSMISSDLAVLGTGIVCRAELPDAAHGCMYEHLATIVALAVRVSCTNLRCE